MRAEADLADRHAAVRKAAREWREAGLLDDEGLQRIEVEYPDDRVRVGPVFRVLLFLFTLTAAFAAAGFVFALFGGALGHDQAEQAYSVLALLMGLIWVVATEMQVGERKRAQGGTEAATSFAALWLILGAFWFWTFEIGRVAEENGSAFFFTLVAAALLAAAWRWGYPLYAMGAALAVLGAVATLPLLSGREAAIVWLPFVRIAWTALGIAAVVFLPRWMDSLRLPPALRQCATGALLVSLASLYLAVDISSIRGYWLEAFGLLTFTGTPPPPPGLPLLLLSMAATVLVPALTIAWGLAARRRPVLILGLLLAGCAAVSLRSYIHVAPLWVVLSLSGVALIALALVLRRYLEGGENQERHGFTAEPPLGGQQGARLLELAAATVRLSPDARDLSHPSSPSQYQGQGGDYGGAGSSSDF